DTLHRPHGRGGASEEAAARVVLDEILHLEERRHSPPSASQQRIRCPGPTGSISGGSSLFSNACGQRGRNRQPEGHAVGGGTAPPIGVSRCTGPVILGTEANRPFVYGCDGRANSSAVVASS